MNRGVSQIIVYRVKESGMPTPQTLLQNSNNSTHAPELVSCHSAVPLIWWSSSITQMELDPVITIQVYGSFPRWQLSEENSCIDWFIKSQPLSFEYELVHSFTGEG